MQDLALMKNFDRHGLKVLFSDIDDTLTDNGRLGPEAYASLWALQRAGVAVVPVTGRPAGWCELIARQWPVHAVVGENGAFYFKYDDKKKKMLRHYVLEPTLMSDSRNKLNAIFAQIQNAFPRVKLASDQFSRQFDLAVDFAEDIDPPLNLEDAKSIQRIFEKNGAQAKVSSIHVNGWFGQYDKLSMCKILYKNEFGDDLEQNLDGAVFVGDSPNDEPMFKFFKWSFGVANIKAFQSSIKNWPAYCASKNGGSGFSEIVSYLLK